MKPRLVAVALCVSLGCGGSQTTTTTTEQPDTPVQPPLAKQVPHQHTEHGQVREDPYFWMRSDDRSDPDVLSHLAAENAYAESVFEPLVARIP
jgi:oligopeptidase B